MQHFVRLGAMQALRRYNDWPFRMQGSKIFLSQSLSLCTPEKSRVYLRKSQGMLFFGAFLVSVHDIIREITTVFISPRLLRGTRELLH